MTGTVSDHYQTPEIKHLYQNFLFDSLRWNFFTFRDDDIVIATSGKTGTTWTQGIVANLIFSGRDLPASPLEMSPWLEQRTFPLELVLTQLEQQTHRRFIKTHLPLDGLRYDQRVKYLYVGRDTRDVFMSWWNHYRGFIEAALIAFNAIPGRVGPELPPCPDDIHDYWRIYMTRGWFDWRARAIRVARPCAMRSRGGTIVTCRTFFLYITRTSWRIFKRKLSGSQTFLKSKCQRRHGQRSFGTALFRR